MDASEIFFLLLKIALLAGFAIFGLLFALNWGKSKELPANINIIVKVNQYKRIEIYHYALPGKSMPSATYERGSYRVRLVPCAENAPAMVCCGHPELEIRGREEMKLLSGALAHINKVDKYA